MPENAAHCFDTLDKIVRSWKAGACVWDGGLPSKAQRDELLQMQLIGYDQFAPDGEDPSTQGGWVPTAAGLQQWEDLTRRLSGAQLHRVEEVIPDSTPTYIALCGHPGSGKTLVQTMLYNLFQVEPYDDGRVLRDFSMRLFGLTWADVSTPDGKERTIVVCGVEMTVRQAMGLLSDALEEKFGQAVIPESAFQAIESLDPRLPSPSAYSFGSVRKQQVWAYRKRLGYVVEVRRPGIGPSGNPFDEWDSGAVTHVLENDGTPRDLERKVSGIFGPLLGFVR